MAGMVGHIGEGIANEEPSLLASMSRAIKYVDSDLVDQWQDGFLAISRVHHGIVNSEKQPLFNEDKSLLILMDGKVYDYEADKRLLRSKGHHFKYKQNDAEFCLHLYEELGIGAFRNLNGSFAIAIYNLSSKELFLVNDRFSSRPLFYYAGDRYLYFGSQLRAILESNRVPRKLDSLAVMEFFTFQRLLGTKTYYQDIKVMLPATILKFGNGKISISQYWEMNYREDERKPEGYYVDALKDTLKQAVRRRTEDKYRYGILLSGGLDSRSVLAASECPMTAFTIADFENREVKIAREIAKLRGCKHHFLKRELNHYPDLVEQAVELGDGMYSFQHGHFIGFFNRIRNECDILLHGCAFGAIFKGHYLPGWEFHVLDKKISLPILNVLSEKTLAPAIFRRLEHSLWDERPGRLFARDFVPDFDDVLERSVRSILSNSYDHARVYCNRYDYFIFYFPFRHFTYLNEICIRHFMEERMVVFDNDLFDLYLEIPPDLRFNGRVLKHALKKLNPKLAKIPNANTGLPPTVPEYVEWASNMGRKIFGKIRQQKFLYPAYTQGSWPNMAELIRHNDKLKQLIWNVINDERCVDPAIFNRTTLVEMFNNHLRHQKDFTWYLLLILTFGVWYKKHVLK